jgi:hypothetical protein
MLAAGDVVFLGINTDATKGYAFTVTKAIGAGTQIGFTDRDYSLSTAWPTNEGAFMWTADQAYAAGTVITITPDQANGTNPVVSHGTALGKPGGMSASGETIYAFQGSIAGLGTGLADAVTATTFLGAINAGGAAAGDAPAGIAIQSVAVDNGFYNGSRAVTDIDAFKAAVLNTTNWTFSDTVPATIVGTEMQFPA